MNTAVLDQCIATLLASLEQLLQSASFSTAHAYDEEARAIRYKLMEFLFERLYATHWSDIRLEGTPSYESLSPVPSFSRAGATLLERHLATLVWTIMESRRTIIVERSGASVERSCPRCKKRTLELITPLENDGGCRLAATCSCSPTCPSCFISDAILSMTAEFPAKLSCAAGDRCAECGGERRCLLSYRRVLFRAPQAPLPRTASEESFRQRWHTHDDISALDRIIEYGASIDSRDRILLAAELEAHGSRWLDRRRPRRADILRGLDTMPVESVLSDEQWLRATDPASANKMDLFNLVFGTCLTLLERGDKQMISGTDILGRRLGKEIKSAVDRPIMIEGKSKQEVLLEALEKTANQRIRSFKCARCGQQGHYTPKCPTDPENQRREALGLKRPKKSAKKQKKMDDSLAPSGPTTSLLELSLSTSSPSSSLSAPDE